MSAPPSVILVDIGNNEIICRHQNPLAGTDFEANKDLKAACPAVVFQPYTRDIFILNGIKQWNKHPHNIVLVLYSVGAVNLRNGCYLATCVPSKPEGASAPRIDTR